MHRLLDVTSGETEDDPFWNERELRIRAPAGQVLRVDIRHHLDLSIAPRYVLGAGGQEIDLKIGEASHGASRRGVLGAQVSPDGRTFASALSLSTATLLTW